MGQTEALTLTTAEGDSPATLERSCLLVFIDETGDEWFSDPSHPVFGLGGCAVLVAEYTSYVRPKWRKMKMLHFGGEDVPLHASELRSPSRKDFEAVINSVSDHAVEYIAIEKVEANTA